ncbi:NAD-binding protein [Salinigranum sp. GCM10025319]|uniref:NAD-binding protein n=1 Tax=Salinigranum sp. GCM10025319 TaxID=3252687 RepID=UPI0036094D35
MRSNDSGGEAEGMCDPVSPGTDAGRVVIVGGGQTGRRLAEQLAADRSVHHADESATALARPRGYETSHVQDVTSTTALTAIGVTADDVAIVLAGRDSRTLLVTQLLRTTFDVERIYAVLVDPRNRDAFDIPGVAVICGAAAVTDAVLDTTADVVALGHPVVDDAAATDVTNTPEPG